MKSLIDPDELFDFSEERQESDYRWLREALDNEVVRTPEEEAKYQEMVLRFWPVSYGSD